MVYETSPIKRRRRTRAEVEALDQVIVSVTRDNRPATLRQLFYRLVSLGVIEKTENQYKAIGRRLTELRWSGAIPFDWIADNTRWMRKPRSFTGLANALALTAQTYRRSLWADAPVYVEVWCEKDALAGVLYDVTEEYDVPLMVSRGYASLTYLHQAAQVISARNRPAFLYYFGDHDPSGLEIPQKIHSTLREMAPEAEIHFARVAVTPEQITSFNLPTRPTKRSDTRAKHFEGGSVEVDAIPPDDLRAIARDCIEQHVNHDRLRILEIAEESERGMLHTFARECRE